MRDYTVHDLSHLDALWEMADLIVGTNFILNPAEAFVFGVAVLLHDAGMTVAAYPGGMEELEGMLGKLRDTGQTVVMATHHLEEGFRLGDRVMVLVSGRAVFTGETARMNSDDFRRQYALSTQNPPLAAAAVP